MSVLNFGYLRQDMVRQQLEPRGITDKKILDAFGKVPRERFVPSNMQARAYQDHPLPIGLEQTISQPFIVALMTQVLDVKKNEKILEIGTGSGYQAAILAELGVSLYSVERLLPLAEKAKEVLGSLGYSLKIRVGDGTLGWEEHAPYDKIIVTAAATTLPQPLIEQLTPGGRLVIPLGGILGQDLSVINKISKTQIKKDIVCGCVFVPLVGKYGYKK